MSNAYEKTVHPLIQRVYSSRTEPEMLQSLDELKSLLTSMIEAEDLDAKETILTALYTVLEIAKIHSISIARIDAIVRRLEARVQSE
jgi:hypothetical protein